MIQNKVIDSNTCENKNNSEFGCDKNCSVREGSSQDLRLDAEDTHKLKSV